MARVRGVGEINVRLGRAAAGPGRILDQACIEGLEPIREGTSDNARALRLPHTPRGGHLDEGVVTAKVKSIGQYSRVFWVSFQKRARYIAHLVEFGTSPHWQPNYRGGWMHPGARAKPFFRPAFDANKDKVSPIMARRLWAGIVESVRGVSK